MSELLSDEQWEVISPLLPEKRGLGRPRANDRRVFEGILYVLRTGCRWKDMPQEFGASVTAWRRLKRWEEQGVWERIWLTLLSRLDEAQKLDWTTAFLDGSFVPAKKGERKSG